MSPTLSTAVFWIAAVACVVAQIGILRATRATPASTTSATRPASPLHRPATRAEEVAWAVLPAVALVIVLALTWRAVSVWTAPPPAVPAAPSAAIPAGGAA